MEKATSAVEWLLASDPAIRWQAMRDLTDALPAAAAVERARVANAGVAHAILEAQQADGAWRRSGVPAWRTTLFTMQLLRATGIDPKDSAVAAAMERLENGVRWNDQPCGWELRAHETGGNTFFEGEVEPCINGGALAAGAYFGRPQERLARRLLSEQLSDGGWNCEAPRSTRSSFHTTICVLEGLLEYELATKPDAEFAEARRRAEEYLLERMLFRRLSTGAVIDPSFLTPAFPPSYCYDVLRALDYLRAAGHKPDARMKDAVEILQSRSQPDGRWLLEACYDTALGISTGEVLGEPSHWNTLRALRVLQWFSGRA